MDYKVYPVANSLIYVVHAELKIAAYMIEHCRYASVTVHVLWISMSIVACSFMQ